MRQRCAQLFLRLHGLWEGIIALPPPPDPPFDIETLEPLDDPPHWGWTDGVEAPPPEWWSGGEPAWQAPERAIDEERFLVLDGDLVPADDYPLFATD